MQSPKLRFERPKATNPCTNAARCSEQQLPSPTSEQSSGDGIPRRSLGTRGNKPLMNHAVAPDWDAMVLAKVKAQIANRK
jgi:hypothetical protein